MKGKDSQTSARSLALQVLVEADKTGGQVEDLLAGALARHPHLPRRERALLLELVQGVKRWELRLDYVLEHLSHLPWPKVHPVVRQILRLGAYQILFLDKIPAPAAVDEAVHLARARRLPAAHLGFINAILRRLAAGEAPAMPDPEAEPLAALSIATAHPRWLVSRWLERFGFEDTKARLEANNRIPPLTVRVNTLKTDPEGLVKRLAREGITAVPCRYSPVGLIFEQVTEPPLAVASYREGLWLFQDEAAQLASFLLPVAPGQALLEIGAGRGGKTSHLGEMMKNQGLILAVDYHRPRLRQLRQNLARWGLDCVQPLQADATRLLPVRPASLDGVLLDVPCSALGIIRRHPEIKTRLKEDDVATFPPRQRQMLEQAAPLLRTGGRLLYITCTTEPEENEVMIAWFLAHHPEYRLIHDPAPLPAAVRPFWQPPGFFRTSPAEHQLDGFFAAVLERQ